MIGRNFRRTSGLQVVALSICLLFVQASCQEHDISKSDDEAKKPAWSLGDFIKVDSVNPILSPSSRQRFFCPLNQEMISWEERNVLNPTALVRDSQVYLLYRAQDLTGTSRIGMAVSTDGLHFSKMENPIFFPANDPMKSYEWHQEKNGALDKDKDYFDGVEDPRIIKSEDGRYLMTYSAYDGQTARLCIASSPDLTNWTKHGLVLNHESHRDIWSKSGAIISELINSEVVATKINGKYWMYFGDTDIFMAHSQNLIDWSPSVNDENGNFISVLFPRPGFFDSRLVEPGPFALMRKEGIVLIYNASNASNYNDPDLPQFTYAAGQALFDKERPYKLIDRTDAHFIHPDKAYEKIGEVNEVCFVEGLVYFLDKWFLYYGTADSKIAVAVSQ